jgi:hypothetical protein
MKPTRKCEICLKLFMSREETVCGKCDRQLEKEQRAHFAKLYAKHKRSCGLCGDELPPTRYFECHICTPDLGGEDPYLEAADDTDIEGRADMYQKLWQPGLGKKLNRNVAKGVKA